MVMGRYDHTTTLLSSGQVLVVGGAPHKESPSAPTTAELYDPVTGRWRATSPPARGRRSHTATLLRSGRVLVAGGEGQSSAELYDPATETWSATGAMAIARSGHTATLLPSGQVLVVGGQGQSSAEVYDPTTGTWSTTGAMATARRGHTATLLPSGQVLVAGGEDSALKALASTELHDPTTGAWTSAAPMALARTSHTATPLLSGEVLITGGREQRLQDSVELYAPGLDTWTSLVPLLAARFGHTATLLPSREVLVTGGFAEGTSTMGWYSLNAHSESYQQAPRGRSASIVTAEEQPLTVLLEAEDPEGDAMTYSVLQAPAHGTLSGTAPVLTYTPHLDFHGEDSVTFQAHDGKLDSLPVTVSLTVTPVNDAPVAHPVSLTTRQGTAVPVTFKVSDVDGDALTFTVVEAPKRGRLLGTAPELTYVPQPAGYGSDSFTYKVSDGVRESEVTAVSITVTPGPGYAGCSSSQGAGAWSQAMVLIVLGSGWRRRTRGRAGHR
jgi:hypothetical protein